MLAAGAIAEVPAVANYTAVWVVTARARKAHTCAFACAGWCANACNRLLVFAITGYVSGGRCCRACAVVIGYS